MRTGYNDLEAICMEVTVKNMVENQIKAERGSERQADTGRSKVGRGTQQRNRDTDNETREQIRTEVY